MAFIPHTDTDVRGMLDKLGLQELEDLFDEIPKALRIKELPGVPGAISEMEIARLMQQRAEADGYLMNYAGAGAYEHHIPAAVWEITTRGEFYSAYTPYQAEASQGTLQVIYEYQSMIASLTAMEVSNASLYDGASALAEACLMAVRANRRSKSLRILMPRTVHPTYRDVTAAITGNQGLQLEPISFAAESGTTPLNAMPSADQAEFAALVIQQPTFFGTLEDVHALTDWAHSVGALVIAVVNPISLALLEPPGEWGEQGADIVCGEGQPLGVPLSSGGPYFGFMSCRQSHVRQMPGRIVGRTEDLDHLPGYVLTLQAREQHIRRSKATSNICTNQGLLVTAATIYMSLLGAEGLERVACACNNNLHELLQAVEKIDGVERAFSGNHFHEATLRLPAPASEVLSALAERGILGGYDLSESYSELGPSMLVCTTETKTAEDIEHYASALESSLASIGVGNGYDHTERTGNTHRG